MNNIFILDGQTDEVLGHINKKYVIDNEHEKDLPSHKDYFRFTVLADNKHAEHLSKRNGLIVPGEDGELLEFRIFESIKYRNNEGLFTEVHALATYLDLKNQKIFDPHKTSAETALQHATIALGGTEWQVGQVDFKGIRTLTFDNPFNSYDYILRIAREFELEPRFYIKTDGNKITGRYVDLVERIGEFRGRTIEFGRDLQRIERKEDTSNIVTALWVYGPQREDGTRLKVFVEDDEARQRWGRRGQHIIDYYEPQTENQDITEERLKTLGEMELRKRINAVVTYEAEILDLENVPGLENKKIRFGDTIRIKDIYFNPPLYLEARIFNVKRDVFNKSKKTVQLGDYREYTEEEVKALFRQMQEEIRRRLERLVLVSIISSAGNVFKNGQGSTQLTAKTFLSGNEVDEDGTKYEYRWHKFDKNGDYVPGFYKEGKTITVNASDIDEKATFRVEIILDGEVLTVHEITLTNVFDGEDGEPGPPGPKGEDGKTFYTWIKYADTPTSGMSDSPEGKEYIGIAYNKETPTPSTNYSDYTWSKFKGEQGIPGPPGEDGQPTYTWVKYADDEHGNGMSDSPDGKLYIGLAFNKTTPEESNNPADYTWSLMPQNIEIGGRNLFSSNGLYKDESVFKNSPYSVIATTSWRQYAKRMLVESNAKYVISAWAKVKSGTTTNKLTLHPVQYTTESGSTRSSSPSRSFAVGADWTYIEYPITTHQDSKSMDLYMIVDPRDTGNEIWVSAIKVEKGDKATDWTPAPEDVQEQIDEAKQEAEEAKQTAQNAQTTADGKNTVFRQSSQPPTTGRKIGDVWFDTSRDNLMHVFNGTQWVEAKWGEQSIVANSITANHIKSLVGLNVNDQFIVDSQGNVTFSGNMDGGNIVGSSFSSSDSGDYGDWDNDGYIGNYESNLYIDDGYMEMITEFNEVWRNIGESRWRDTITLYPHDPNADGPQGNVGIAVKRENVLIGDWSSIQIDPEGRISFQHYDHMTNNLYGQAIWINDKGELSIGLIGSELIVGDGIHSNSNITVGSTSGYINLRPGNEHGFIEFYRTEGRAAYVGIPSADSEYFDINAHGLNGEIRLRGRNVLVEQRLISPQTYNVTVQNPANVYVTSNGYFARSTSSKRYKADIQYNDIDYKNILKLKQASWVDRNEFENNNMSAEGLKRYYGAIAEDFEKIGLSEFVVYNENGEVENFSDRAWVLLIPNINDVLHELKQIKERLGRLENEGNSV